MIKDKFTVKDHSGPVDNATLRMLCKTCQHEFDVVVNILLAKNCRHELGKSFTVICPSCKTEATQTDGNEKTYQHENLTQMQSINQTSISQDPPTKLRKTVVEGYKNLKIKLRLLRRPQIVPNFGVTCQCLECGHDFCLEPKTGCNVCVIHESFTIRCPACGAATTLPDSKLEELMLLLLMDLRLRYRERALAGENINDCK